MYHPWSPLLPLDYTWQLSSRTWDPLMQICPTVSNQVTLATPHCPCLSLCPPPPVHPPPPPSTPSDLSRHCPPPSNSARLLPDLSRLLTPRLWGGAKCPSTVQDIDMFCPYMEMVKSLHKKTKISIDYDLWILLTQFLPGSI